MGESASSPIFLLTATSFHHWALENTDDKKTIDSSGLADHVGPEYGVATSPLKHPLPAMSWSAMLKWQRTSPARMKAVAHQPAM